MEIIQVLCFRTQKEAFSEDATSEAPGLKRTESSWSFHVKRAQKRLLLMLQSRFCGDLNILKILVPWDDCQGQQQLWSEAYMHQRDEILVLYM